MDCRKYMMEPDSEENRQSDVIRIEEYNPHEDRDAVSEIWQSQIGGVEEKIAQWLDQCASDSQTTAFVAKHTRRHTPRDVTAEIVGFAVATYALQNDVQHYIGELWDVDLPSSEPIGICATVAIKEEYQSSGIGTELVTSQLWYLSQQDIEYSIAMSWRRDDRVDSYPLFQKLGFEELQTIPDYYALVESDVPCPDCEGACQCGSSLFLRKVGKDERRPRRVNYPSLLGHG